jgi:hypothetical protein
MNFSCRILCPCNISSDLVAVSSPRRPRFNPSDFTWDPWWTDWYWSMFFSYCLWLSCADHRFINDQYWWGSTLKGPRSLSLGFYPWFVTWLVTEQKKLLLYFFKVAPQLCSRGWVDPVPDPLLLRKSGSAGNRTRNFWICSQELWPLDHRGDHLRPIPEN